MTENEKYLYDHFLIDVKSGFESLDDIIDGAIEAVEEEGWEHEISEQWIRETFTREYEKNLQASKAWSTTTDPIRLAEVFNQLCSKDKILAVHNIGYTNAEAVYDTQDLWEQLEDEDIHPIGYCYYHGQDLERVITDGNLLIGFSGMHENNEKGTIQIGVKVATALENAGFAVKWKNTASDRICIENFNWQNVFTSHDEVEEKWGHDRVFQLIKE